MTSQMQNEKIVIHVCMWICVCVWASTLLSQAQLKRVTSAQLYGLIYTGKACRTDQTKERTPAWGRYFEREREKDRTFVGVWELAHFVFWCISIGERANRPLSYQIETNKLRWFVRLPFSCFCSLDTDRSEGTLENRNNEEVIKLYLRPIKFAEVIISAFLLWCCDCCCCSWYCFSVGCKRNKCDEKLFDTHCEMLSTRILEGLYKCCK